MCCDRESDRALFLRRAANSLPATALRFSCGRHDVTVLFLRADGETARRFLAPLTGAHGGRAYFDRADICARRSGGCAMTVQLYREYRLKFYLNARHFVIFDGNRGELHPHTWELALTIRIGRGSFTQFHTFEACINDCLARFQNQILNECEPFDAVLPTLENLADVLSEEFYDRLASVGGELTRLEISETPTRSYILDLERTRASRSGALEAQMMGDMIDTVLDDLL